MILSLLRFQKKSSRQGLEKILPIHVIQENVFPPIPRLISDKSRRHIRLLAFAAWETPAQNQIACQDRPRLWVAPYDWKPARHHERQRSAARVASAVLAGNRSGGRR